MSDYVSDQQILDYFRSVVGNDFALSDIPSVIRTGAYEMINQVSDYVWETPQSETIYIDGRGIETLFVPKPPIVEIISITVIDGELDETELVVDQTDTDRDIWYDTLTGRIELINSFSYLDTDENLIDEYNVFPNGIGNIKIVGRFGQSTPANILSMLQLTIMMRQMSVIDPQVFGGSDIVKERIGKYEYVLLGYSSSNSVRMSVDEYIKYLFSMLPNHSKFYFGDV